MTADPNEATAFGVLVTPMPLNTTGLAWRLRRVRALTGAENGGNHTLYVEAYGLDGAKVRGVKAEITYQFGTISPRTVTLDKPLNEYGANEPLWLSQVVGVRMAGLPSDYVGGIHTKHPDGEAGNTTGHYSFVAEFEQVNLGAVVIPPPVIPPQPPVGNRPPTVIIDAANVARLRTYPRPPGDNGIGLHFCLDLTDANIARTVGHLREIRATWTLIYAQDELQAERAARACFNAGIMPVVRVGKLITDYANSAAYVAALRRALAGSTFVHDPAKPPLYVQICNEPEDSREWKDGQRPANWPQVFAGKWVAEAVQVFAAGGYPGLQVLDRTAFDAVVDAVEAQGAGHLWERAWFCHHNYGVNHVPSYPYDARNQQDKPGATILDDYQCALRPLAHAAWMKERIGFVLPLIGGEGGWWVGNEEDKRYPKLTWTGLANYTKEMFEWFRLGVLSNGEPLPDYLFSITSWIAESATFASQAWWRNILSPDGTATEAIAAVKGIPIFVRQFSWDAAVTPPTPPVPPPTPPAPAAPFAMNLHPPLDGPLVTTQEFGANKQVYEKYNLPGHEGWDLRAKEGTPVYAVDDATVALSSNVGPYGEHLRLVHTWGETVVAHLSKRLVTKGRVVKGQVIGLSGNTGNSEAPHLHFGMRLNPFFRDSKLDRWQGFVNPKKFFLPPYLLVSPHIHTGGDSMIPILRQWQPPVALVLKPNVDFINKFAAVSPKTEIVGRIYVPDSEVADRVNRDPKAAALWMHNLVLADPAFATGKIKYWQIANEICQGPNWDDFLRLNVCMDEWMTLARNIYGCGLYAVGVGHPDVPKDDPNWWNAMTPNIVRAQQEGHVILAHEYGVEENLNGPADRGGAPFHIQRLTSSVLHYLQGMARDVQFIISETGYDGLLIGDKPAGWRSTPRTAEVYTNELLNLNDRYAMHRNQIKGVCVYTWQTANKDRWVSYDIDGEVSQRLAARAEQLRAGEPVVVPPVVVGDPADAGWIAAARQQRLQLNPGAALQKVMVTDGFAPVTSEFTFSQDGISYIGQVAERVDRAEKARLFYCPVGKWGDVRQEVEP